MLPPKPARFIPATEPRQAKFASQTPSFISTKRHRGKRATGIRYERRAQEILLQEYPTYVASPWLTFLDDKNKLHWCQPDGFFLDLKRGIITIAEIKIKHTSDAWWQIWHLYVPVMRNIFPTYEFRGIEIVKWYDPAVVFPKSVMTDNMLYPPAAPNTGVHILRA